MSLDCLLMILEILVIWAIFEDFGDCLTPSPTLGTKCDNVHPCLCAGSAQGSHEAH